MITSKYVGMKILFQSSQYEVAGQMQITRKQCREAEDLKLKNNFLSKSWEIHAHIYFYIFLSLFHFIPSLSLPRSFIRCISTSG